MTKIRFTKEEASEKKRVDLEFEACVIKHRGEVEINLKKILPLVVQSKQMETGKCPCNLKLREEVDTINVQDIKN